jgi:hypothetical protein
MGSNGNRHGGDGEHSDLTVRPELEMYIEVLREALGEVVAHERRNWQREMARMQAEANEIIARLRAEIAELRGEFMRVVNERLALVRDGKRGPPGEPGAPGERGEPGPPGKLPIAKVWREGISYEGEVALYDGATWQAKNDTAQVPGGSDWLCLAAAGASPKVRGTWREDGAYKRLDVVANGGGAFVATRDNPGALPGNGWQMIAMPGKKGPEGPRGERGPKGDTGAPGVGIVDIRIDAENYVVKFAMSDGDVASVDFRPLFEAYHRETT